MENIHHVIWEYPILTLKRIPLILVIYVVTDDLNMAPRKGWSHFILPTLIVSLALTNTIGAFTRTYDESLFAPKIQVQFSYHSLLHII